MNEYRTYLMAVQRWLPVWLLLSLVVAALVFGAMRRLPPTYSVHFSYLVSLAEREEATEYTFDGFYALQATDLFATTLAKWIETPELIVSAYREARLTLPTEDARRLRRTVGAIKTAPQLIEVTVSGVNSVEAEQLATALIVVTKRAVDLYDAEGTPALKFNVVATSPWTSVGRTNVPLVVGSVFGVTLILLINIQLLWTSLMYARRD